jgi:hypothetical protein
MSNRSDVFYGGRVPQRPDDDSLSHGEVDWFDPEEGWGAIRGYSLLHKDGYASRQIRTASSGDDVRWCRGSHTSQVIGTEVAPTTSTTLAPSNAKR